MGTLTKTGLGRWAILSRCMAYRYWLEIDLGMRENSRALGVCMLNPSTADESQDDPTVRRVLGYARKWEFGRVIIVNAYAFRSTDPKCLRSQRDPVGPENDEHIVRAGSSATCMLVAWGAHIDEERERAVTGLLAPVPLWCLGVTKQGHPKHPLYLRADAERVLFRVDSGCSEVSGEDAISTGRRWSGDRSANP